MPDKQKIDYAILAGIFIVGAAAIISLVERNVAFFMVDGAIAAAVYLLGYQNVKQGNLDTAKQALLGCAFVVGLLATMGLLQGDPSALPIAGVAISGWVYAFSKLNKQTSPAPSSPQSSPGGAPSDVVEQIRQLFQGLRRPADRQAPSDVVEQIRQLRELLNAGLITKEEFEAKKTELLSRI